MPIYGTATLKGNSVNNGEIDTAEFTDNSVNHGEVHSDATFTDNSSNNGMVAGDASFGGQSVNDGMVDGAVEYVDDAVEPEELVWDSAATLSENQIIQVEELAPALAGIYDDDNVFAGGVDDPFSVPVDSFTAYSDIDPMITIPLPASRVQELALEQVLESKTYQVDGIRIHSDFIFRNKRESFGNYKNAIGGPALVSGDNISDIHRSIKIMGRIAPLPERKDFFEALPHHITSQVIAEGPQFAGYYVTYGAYAAKCIDEENGTMEYYNKAGELIETRIKTRDIKTGKSIGGTAAWRGRNSGNQTFVAKWLDDGRGMIGRQTYKRKDLATGAVSIIHDCVFASPLHAIVSVDRALRKDPRYTSKTCVQMMRVYAPPGDNHNNPAKYAAFLQKRISNPSVNLSTTKYIDLDPKSRGELLAGIWGHEGQNEGTIIPGPGKPDKVRIDLYINNLPLRARTNWAPVPGIDVLIPDPTMYPHQLMRSTVVELENGADGNVPNLPGL